MQQIIYGLIGKKLSHSFSKKYFTEKFEKEGPDHCRYELFELEEIRQLPQLIASNPGLKGLNVTIPYKEVVIPFLHQVDTHAARIGAVNVIKVKDQKLYGYNSDFYGFRNSLAGWLGKGKYQALVMGSGGASRAVTAALDDLQIGYTLVSRTPGPGRMTYEAISPEIISTHQLIINTTPLGMYPEVDSYPPFDYGLLTPGHFLYDLVYNPAETLFMKKGREKGAQTKNGMEMLRLQAEKSWELWNDL